MKNGTGSPLSASYLDLVQAPSSNTSPVTLILSLLPFITPFSSVTHVISRTSELSEGQNVRFSTKIYFNVTWLTLLLREQAKYRRNLQTYKRVRFSIISKIIFTIFALVFVR